MPRTIDAIDPIYHEDSNSSYSRAYLIEMLFKYPGQGFGGMGDILDQGGLNILDTMTLVVARKTFIEEVGDHQPQVRPLEGDLIYFPFNRKIFRVEFVEHESTFYQGGALQVWELRCQLFQYSGEDFDTGIEEIDDLTDGYNQNILGQGLILEGDSLASMADEEQGLPILFEEYVDTTSGMLGEENDYYQQRGLEIIDWTEDDPFADGETY